MIVAAHLVMPEQKWLGNLLASAVAGGLAYLVVVLAVGLPAKERDAATRVLRRVTGRC